MADAPTEPEKLLTPAQVIWWWELRRLLYNGVLLIIGIVSISAMELMLSPAIPLGEDAVEPMILVLGITLYGLMANVCYTSGWIIEVWSRGHSEREARRRARWMFRTGFLFSCALTSLPFWYACAWWVARTVVALLA